MATYEDIYGKRVKEFDSDPTLDSSYEGQVWYNSATGTLKSVVAFGAMSSGATASVVAYNLGGAGTQTAGLAFGGANSTGVSSLASTEEYNGSGWSTAEDLPGATSYTGGCGTQTAALQAAGAGIPAYASTTSRHYDGTNWTSGGTMNTATGSAGQLAGILTAALIAGGDRVPGAPRSIANAEEYNGSSWTSVTSLPAVRQYAGVAGIQTAALYWGGYADTNPGTPNTQYNTTLEYDGTNWTSGGNLPAVRKSAAGTGTQSDALSFGGNPGTTPTNLTQILNYNGSTWSVNPATLASGRQHMAYSSSAPSTATFLAKGVVGTAVSAATEEWNFSINTITAAAWASTPSLGTARRQVGGFGHTTTTAVCACGQNPPALSNVEEYDGSSWSEVNNAPIARVKPFACGVLTAGLIGGGESGPSPVSFQSSAEYDGTNWTASPSSAIGQDTGDGTAFGIQTAALLVIGSQSPNTAVKYYDGSTWTAGPAATPTSMASASGNGIQTNGLVYGNSPSQTTTLEWDGSSWTSGGALTSGRHRGAEAVGAPSTAALYFGGNNPSSTELTATEGYDGTSWSSRPNMATARRGLGGAGVNTLSLAFGGYTGSDTAATEEFTGVTETVTSKTLTTG